MRQLQRLCEQEEKKLGKLGKQKLETQEKIATIHQQKQTLSRMSNEYHRHSAHGLTGLQLQNTANMIQAIVPIQTQLTRQEKLLQHEQQRMDGLWRKQLGRQQSMKWLYQQKLQEQVDAKNRQEQKQSDDLAGFYRLVT